MGRAFDRWYDHAMRVAPARVSARLDSARPSLRHRWGGPLNGQEVRQQIVRDLARAIDFNRVYETGTYRGTTSEFFLAVFGCPIFTVELSDRFYRYSAQRLSYSGRLNIERGDSRTFLRRYAATAEGETAFIYLDAHWRDDLPLREEIQIIKSGWPRVVVMIDDFRVPGDPGYKYDDYGPGKVIAEEALPADDLEGWHLFYPSAPSSEETGACRGCCLLASEEVAALVRVPSLRRGHLHGRDVGTTAFSGAAKQG